MFLVTNFDVSRGKTPFIKYYLSDFEHLYGPLCLRWHPFYISKALTYPEVSKVMQIIGENEAHTLLSYEPKRYSAKKQVIFLRGPLNKHPSNVLRSYFYKQSATEIIRLTHHFPDQCIAVDRNIEHALHNQREAHSILRDIHDKSLEFRISVKDKKKAERQRRKFLRDEVKKSQKLDELLKESRYLVQELDPRHSCSIDPIKHNFHILLDSNPGHRPNGVELKQVRLFTKDLIDELFKRGKVVVTDTEFGEYKTPDPFTYLDTFARFEGDKTKGEIFSLYPIDADFLETEDGRIPFFFHPEPLALRRAISRYRFDREYIFIGGQNNLSFDEQKTMHAQRETKKNRMKGDDGFLVGCDNSEASRVSDKGGMELLRFFGPIGVDTFRIAKSYFTELFPDTKLETVMAWFNMFLKHPIYNFKKSYQSYSVIEEERREWDYGDIEKGKAISAYGYYDSKAPLHILKVLLPAVVNIARAVSCEVYDAGVKSPKELSLWYWERENFKATNHPLASQHLKEEKYPVKGNQFRNLLSNTSLLSEIDIRATKKRLLEHKLEHSSRDIAPNAKLSYVPLLAKGFESLLRRGKAEPLYLLAEQEEHPLLKIMYTQLLDCLAAKPLLDLNQVLRGKLHPIVFCAKYRPPQKENALSTVEHCLSEFETYVGDVAESLDGNIIEFTGNYLFSKKIPKDSIPLGASHVIPIKEIYSTKAAAKNAKKKTSIIFSLKNQRSATGIKIPSEKVRRQLDPLATRTPYLEVKCVYDFLQTYFKEGTEKALIFLADFGKKLAKDEFPVTDYLRTIKRNKVYAENQLHPDVRILDYFQVSKGKSVTYAIERRSDGYYPKQYDESINPTEHFRSATHYYQHLVFGGHKKMENSLLLDPKSDIKKTTLYRIVTSLCFPNHKKDGKYWQKAEAYHNIKLGIGTETDMRILLTSSLKEEELSLNLWDQ